MAEVTLNNIKNFIQGYSRDVQKRISELPEHVEDQFIERSNACKPCLEKGGCVVCGCKTPQLFLADKGCPSFRYPAMRSKSQWKLYKDIMEGKENIELYNKKALELFKTPVKGDDDKAIESLLSDKLIFQDLQMYVARYFNQSMHNTPSGITITVEHKLYPDINFKVEFDYSTNTSLMQKKIYAKIFKTIFTGQSECSTYRFDKQNGQFLPNVKCGFRKVDETPRAEGI